jgi:hypothetical protein
MRNQRRSASRQGLGGRGGGGVVAPSAFASALGESSEPSEIDGMDVLFDKRVTLFPVSLVEEGKGAGANGAGVKKTRLVRSEEA